MFRKVFSSDEIADIVMHIIGEIEPVGESNEDERRIDHMRTLINTIDELFDEIIRVLPSRYREEASMSKACKIAIGWLEDKKEDIEYILEEIGDKDG